MLFTSQHHTVLYCAVKGKGLALFIADFTNAFYVRGKYLRGAGERKKTSASS